MRIPGKGEAVDQVVVGRSPSRAAAPAGVSASPDKADKVQLSDKAQAIQSGTARSDAARAARVAEVREKIHSGTYKVDKDALAAKIADDELMRAGRK